MMDDLECRCARQDRDSVTFSDEGLGEVLVAVHEDGKHCLAVLSKPDAQELYDWLGKYLRSPA